MVCWFILLCIALLLSSVICLLLEKLSGLNLRIEFRLIKITVMCDVDASCVTVILCNISYFIVSVCDLYVVLF